MHGEFQNVVLDVFIDICSSHLRVPASNAIILLYNGTMEESPAQQLVVEILLSKR
jgi:hypothetical protein